MDHHCHVDVVEVAFGDQPGLAIVAKSYHAAGRLRVENRHSSCVSETALLSHIACSPPYREAEHEAARTHHSSRRGVSMAARRARPAARAGSPRWRVEPFPRERPGRSGRGTAFVQALGRFGWVEGKNIRIDYRFAAGDPTLFKTYAAELVGLSPDVLLAGASLAIAALRQQTRTIPIVFVNVSDPVGQGFVESLARPGGNITGFTAYDAPLMGKWLQLLKEIAPSVTRVVVIFNPDTAPYAVSPHRTIAAT